MQECCGAKKSRALLEEGLERLAQLQEGEAQKLYARNPHDWMRGIETLNVLTNAELVIHACLARRASSKQLNFTRTDCPEMDPDDWHKFVTVKKRNGGIEVGELSIDYYGPLAQRYQSENQDYIEGTWKKT